jgi:predicted O-methyltransferase YrrM
MLRKLQPKRVIEVGSGYSSAPALLFDTNQLFMDGSVEYHLIEPHPAGLRRMIKKPDRVAIHEQPVQSVDLALFETLAANDLLFIDSSHISKAGSDVNQILFKILPRLREGVVVHFHDILFPFEYPESWVMRRYLWNKNYLLKAFLQYNQCCKVTYVNDFVARFHAEVLRNLMPLCMKNTGESIYLIRSPSTA